EYRSIFASIMSSPLSGSVRTVCASSQVRVWALNSAGPYLRAVSESVEPSSPATQEVYRIDSCKFEATATDGSASSDALSPLTTEPRVEVTVWSAKIGRAHV